MSLIFLPYCREQCEVVEGFLKELDISDKPVITVLNKMDAYWTPEKNGRKEKPCFF
jgi:50S ribosomal subunit-associated GTPase HflX